MQNVINTVKGKALEVAEYLTPVLKVRPRLPSTKWGGEEPQAVTHLLPDSPLRLGLNEPIIPGPIVGIGVR